jgi:hypothetical protein
MNKRNAKRQKREASRAKARVRVSEPDVRTPEQIRAAREASQPAGGWRNGPSSHLPTRSGRNQSGSTASSPAKVDA